MDRYPKNSIEALKSLMETELEQFSIDDFLRVLIRESDLSEVVGCLDQIAKEFDKKIFMYGDRGREYPHPEADLNEVLPEGVKDYWKKSTLILGNGPFYSGKNPSIPLDIESTPCSGVSEEIPPVNLKINKEKIGNPDQEPISINRGDDRGFQLDLSNVSVRSNDLVFLSDPEKEPEPVKNKYKGGFFKNRHRLSWRCAPVCQALINTFDLRKPANSPYTKAIFAIDVGCAIGDYVKWFNENTDVVSWGIEGSEAAKEFFQTNHITIHDIRKPFTGDVKRYGYELAYSLEVAEHIEQEYDDIYLDNLCRLSDRVLITAAPPGQGGHGHVNCQPPSYWAIKMAKRGYERRNDLETKFKYELKAYSHRKEIACYINNVIIFTLR